jgi:hypothetical protein
MKNKTAFLLLFVLLSFGVKAQTDTALKFTGALWPKNTYLASIERRDTSAVIMLVCDTTFKNGVYFSVSTPIGAVVEFPKNRFPYVYWVFGYSVSVRASSYIYVTYLDENKKPFTGVVWLSQSADIIKPKEL